ncbi:hypothetical protein RCS94_02145 [Orbaceae bacterium ac157xtp]
MFIIWGTGGNYSVAGSESFQRCDDCNDTRDFLPVVFYRYFHIFYLFSFLTSRRYAYVCKECGDVQYISRSEFKQKFQKDNVPFIRKYGWLLCLIVLGAFIGFSKISEHNSTERALAAISQPQVDDVYYADLAKINNSGFGHERHAYGLMKIISEKNGNYFVVLSDSAYSHKKGVKQNLSTMSYSDLEEDILPFTQKEIENLFNTNVIYKVERN